MADAVFEYSLFYVPCLINSWHLVDIRNVELFTELVYIDRVMYILCMSFNVA